LGRPWGETGAGMTEQGPTKTGEASPRKQPLSRRISWLLWGGLVALVVVMGSAFTSAWQTNTALRAELATLEPMVTVAQMEQNALASRLLYVQSDEYVEDWSRSRAKMALPGEVLVVSVAVTPTPTVRPLAVPTATPEPTPEPFWVGLWEWVTGE